MKLTLYASIFGLFTSLSTLCYGGAPKMNETEVSVAKGDQMFQNQAFAFTENMGQIKQMDGKDAYDVLFFLQQGNANIYLLRSGGIAFQFNRTHLPEGFSNAMNKFGEQEAMEQMLKLEKEIQLETYRMNMHLVNANPNADIIPEGKSNDFVNYYNHDVLNVYHFERVTYKDIYPGIDWVIYISEGGFKYDFIVHPGADPDEIELTFSHHEELYLDEDGNLIHGNRMGSFTEKAPVSFQNNQNVPTNFVLEGNTLSFALGEYDSNQTLTIDPARVWGTYYGGSSWDQGFASAVDKDENVYLAGATRSNTNISDNGHQNMLGGNSDAFLVKFDSNGVRQWATYYGGNSFDNGRSIAVDGNNNVYLAGTARSSSGISHNGHQNARNGSSDAFLVKFNSNGVRQWATYYGGNDWSLGFACALEGESYIYLVGHTTSTLGIAFNGHQNSLGGESDAFLVKFNSNGVRQWGTYYGGGSSDVGTSVATDGEYVILAGTTTSTNGIANNGHQNSYATQVSMVGYGDAFLAKFNASGNRVWGTYYGGSGGEKGNVIAVDGNGNYYLAGTTYSTSNIAFNGHQMVHGNQSLGGWQDAFLVKFNSNGVRQWATYYGGSSSDVGVACDVDVNNNIYLAGSTNSTNNIAHNGYKDTLTWRDVYMAKFNSNGMLQWGTYFGGDQFDTLYSIALGGSSHFYISGGTNSLEGIALNGHQMTHNSPFNISTPDAFLVKFHVGSSISVNDYFLHENSIDVYPNPTNNFIQVTLPEENKGQQNLIIIDAKGQVVKAISVKSNSINVDVSDLASGVYFVRVSTTNGIISRKMIKQ
ncbi:MAG: T9SS type A sorting domain-containing protein [Cryomorphaceae bacterium]|nr:T9SS type A sorting domain-containing protein [Cryomorphaceae bacterium]